MPREGLSAQVLKRTNRVREKIESIICLSEGVMVAFLDDIGKDLSEIEQLCQRKTIEVTYATPATGMTSDSFLDADGLLDVVKVPRARAPRKKGPTT
jgi:hypothetical protein